MKKEMRVPVIVLTALLFFASCGEKTSTWQEQYDLGVRYLSEGNYEEAIIAFTAAIELDPNRPEAFIGRGNAYVGVAEALNVNDEAVESPENRALAIKDYNIAINLDPTNQEVYLRLVDIYMRNDNIDSAQSILERGYQNTSDEVIKSRLEEIEQLHMDLQYMITSSFATPSDWLINGKPILECKLEDMMQAYPDASEMGIYTGDSIIWYTPMLRTSEGTHGSGNFQAAFVQSELREVNFRAPAWDVSFQLDFRTIQMMEPMKTVLEKLGFSEYGVSVLTSMDEDEYDRSSSSGLHLKFRKNLTGWLMTIHFPGPNTGMIMIFFDENRAVEQIRFQN